MKCSIVGGQGSRGSGDKSRMGKIDLEVGIGDLFDNNLLGIIKKK